MSLTVNNKAGAVAGASQTVAISVAAGHTIAVFAFDRLGTGTVTDSAGNTYTAGNSSSIGGYTSATYWSIAIGSPITSVTYTSASSTGNFVMVWDITATGAITASDSGAQTYNSSTVTGANNATTGTLSVTSGDGLILGGCANFSSGTMTIGTGFTSDLSLNSGQEIGEHRAVTVSAVASFTASTGGQVAGVGGIALQVSSGGGTVYNLSVSDSGSAADSLSNTLTAVNALTEAGTAAMTAAGALTANNALTESGTAADTVSGGLALAGSVSEAGSAADTVTGTPAYSNAVSESGSAADSLSNALSAANAVAEAGTAADSLSTVLTAVNSVSEAGSAADTVSPGNIYAQNVSEAGSAADSLANQLTAVGAVSEAGSAADAVDPSGSTFGVFLTEALNSADAISATGGSAPVIVTPPPTQGGAGFARGGKRRKGDTGPFMREGQVFGEEYPPAQSIGSPLKSEGGKGQPQKKSRRVAESHDDHRPIIEAMLRELL